MDFCKKCGNINYIRIKDETKQLEYYCKNCENITDYNNDNLCIYTKKINNDFYIHNITNNKWIIKDPTLPVLNNIQCINNNCIINNYYDFSVVLYNNDKNIIDEIYKELKEDIEKPIELGNKYIFIFKSKNNYDSSLSNLEKICKDKKVDLKKNKKMENKVTFVKYHNDDMKYLYICNYCNRSWKNN